MTVQKGSKVSMHYVLKIDGEKVDSSEGREPLTFVQGEGKIVPGIEEELEGLDVGDKKSVTIQPAKGFGERQEELVQKLPRSAFKDVDGLSAGNVVAVHGPDGKAFQATVIEIEEENVTLDLNHPLAGKTLNFEVEITGIKDAPSRIIKPGQ